MLQQEYRATRFGLWALVFANLLVGLQAALRGWGYYEALLVYWLEAIVIGGYNVLRLLVVGMLSDRPLGALSRWVGFSSGASRLMFTLFGTGFFVFKFAAFALAVGVLVIALPAALPPPGGGGGAEVAEGVRAAGPGVAIAVGFLLLSHGYSFVHNFLMNREYASLSIVGLIFYPYARMILVALVLGLGFVVAQALPAVAATTAFVVALVLVKLAADGATHRFEHQRLSTRSRQSLAPERPVVTV